MGRHGRRPKRLGCAFCNRTLDGLPHKCKYCGELHCSNHILPESHNCEGLSNIPKRFGSSRKFSNHLSFGRSRRGNETHDQRYFHKINFKNSHNKQRYIPKFELPEFRINSFFKGLIIAVLSYFLASYFTNRWTLIIELVAWIYFSYIIYRKAFRWANRINLGNDLSFFGLRLLGGAIVFFGLYIGLFTFLGAILAPNSAPQYIPVFVLLFGLIALALFITFRTNRRHHVVGVWRA